MTTKQEETAIWLMRDIVRLTDEYSVCECDESTYCMDCDLLRKIGDIAQGALDEIEQIRGADE